MMKRTAHICTVSMQCFQRSPHISTVNLQPCSVPRIYARSICSHVMPSAYMRAHFAALQQQIASMRGEIAKGY